MEARTVGQAQIQLCPPAILGPRRPAAQRPIVCSRQQLSTRNLRLRRGSCKVSAEQDDVRERVGGVIKGADTFAEGATDAVTGGLPRPLVKGAIVLVGGLFAWSLLKKALSLSLFFGALGGGLFLFFKLNFQGNRK